jgi:hypothetical protein
MEVTAMHARYETEPIFHLLACYRAELESHPLIAAARSSQLPTEILLEFAYHQYSDSILWIPMLAQMKSKATRSRRLREAIADNIACEAGLTGESHVTLAVAMLRSLGVTDLAAFPTQTLAANANEWLSAEFAAYGEPEVAGWLLVAETMVPILFAELKPCFDKLGCDTKYFAEHVAVDRDVHASWMAEAVADVVATYGPSCVSRVTAGMLESWQETIEVPDALWGRRCASP